MVPRRKKFAEIYSQLLSPHFYFHFYYPPLPNPSTPDCLRCRRRRRRHHSRRRRRRRQSFNSNLEMSSLNGPRLAPMSWQKKSVKNSGTNSRHSLKK